MTQTPVEGWVQGKASYGLTIVRAAVTNIRDRGPLDMGQVLAVIVAAGIGGDVIKASPVFNSQDGAERILNLLVTDIAEIHCEDGCYTVAPEVRSVFSAALNRFIDTPSSEDLAAQQEASRRFQHLRRWIATEPFRTVWRNGLRHHDDEEIAAMAAHIERVGYYGAPIITDQNGTVIDGHLRIAALAKLGIEVSPYEQEVFFPNDVYRLAWVINAHFRDGQWPYALKKEIKRYIDHCMARSGVKMGWPDDIPTITGRLDGVPGLGVGPLPDVEPESKPTPKPAPKRRHATPKISTTSKRAFVLMEMLRLNRPVTSKDVDLSKIFHLRVGMPSDSRDWVEYDKNTGTAWLNQEGIEGAKEIWHRAWGNGREVPDYTYAPPA